MIYIESLADKLGNQLFQIAAATALAKKYNNTVAFPEWKYAKYFNGDFTPYTGEVVIDAIWIGMNEFHYTPIEYTKNVVLQGYFQSEKYFTHCKRYIKNIFTLKNINTNYIIDENSCAIHIRRGDYCNLQEFHPLKTWDNYYNKAVSYMDKYNPTYYIFSDDIASIKEEFPKDRNFNFVEGNDEITDFYLMTKCKYSIIANSTFSWWSAWLKNQNGLLYHKGDVIAPKEWFGPAYYEYETKDIYPEGWIII